MGLQNPTRRNFLTGLGAAAAAPAFLGAANATPLEEIGMPDPIAPNGGILFHHYRFNQQMKEAYPEFRPAADLPAFQRDKFIIMNFIDGTEPFRDRSILQMRVLRDLAQRLAPVIGPKEFLVAEITVRDETGTPIYLADYEALYAENRIGRKFSNEERRIVPYGVAYSSSLRNPELGVQKLLDFSVSALHPSEAQMRENVHYIAVALSQKAIEINPDRLARAEPVAPDQNL